MSPAEGEPRPGPAPGAAGRDDPDSQPWVETPAGGLFFLNAVLVAPLALVLFPLVVGGLLRAVGAVQGPSPLWDPIPAVAAHVGPVVGWLAVIPLALTIRNLVIVDRPGPRAALLVFLGAHVGVLAWTAAQWIR